MPCRRNAAQLSVDSASRLGRIVRSRWLAGAFAGAVLLAWALFLRGQLHELSQFSWHIHPLLLLTSVGLGACYFAGLAFCWALIVRQIDRAEQTVALADSMSVWLLSMITRYIPGNVWHILSRVAFAQRLGVSKGLILASATVEQLLTLLGALALWGLTLPLWRIASTDRIWLLLLLLVGLLLLHPRLFGRLLRWVAAKIGRPTLAWNYTYGELCVIVGSYVAANSCAGLALCAIVSGIVPISVTDVPMLIGTSALAWSVGYLSFLTPSGLGVREAVLTAVLIQIYPAPVAVIAPLLFRVVLTVGELVAVGISYLYEKSAKNINEGSSREQSN